jgi:hypothetical protein
MPCHLFVNHVLSPCQTVALPIPFAKARPLIEIVNHQAIPAEDRKGISSHDAC